MATNLYSKRQKSARGKQKTTVYQVSKMPRPLRVQILNIFGKIIGDANSLTPNFSNYIHEQIVKLLRHEYGREYLAVSDYGDISHTTELRDFFLSTNKIAECLDVIEVFVTSAQTYKTLIDGPNARFGNESELTLEQGVSEINERFKEHGVGFQIVLGQIVRIDSEVLFQNAVAPALELLRQQYLSGASQEFLSAHDHFRHGRYPSCLNECLKAFESTMKAICHKRGWTYNQTDTAKALIKICEDNKLFPVFMENHLTGLRMSLESGVPTARNKTSGHGQGAQQITLSEEFASYVLNLTAANILFLANSEKRLK